MALVPALMLAASCSQKDSASLRLRLEGAPDSSMVVVSRLNVNQIEILDTLYTKEHKALDFETQVIPGSPEFIYVSGGGANLSLLLNAGDKVEVTSAWPIDGNATIEGSPESVLMQEVDSAINGFNARFSSLYNEILSMDGNSDQAELSRLKRELGMLYVSRKQEAIRYILEHPKSLTVIPVLYQVTPNGLQLFSEATDAIIMGQVYDSLHMVYPSSPYLVSLADEVQFRRNALEMRNMLSSAETVDFPEIIMSDINGEERSLSALKGKVIALIFWDPSVVEQRIFNVGLKELYAKYHNAGFEIYQVAMNTDKTSWALQVREQALPWINVCDPTVSLSAATLYNVTETPAMFVISRDGEITARNLFNADMLEGEVSRLL